MVQFIVPFPIKNMETNEEKIYKKYFATEEEAYEEIKQYHYKSGNKIFIENNGIPIYKLMEHINEKKLKNRQVQIGQYGDNKRKIERISKLDSGKYYIGEYPKTPAGKRDIPIPIKLKPFVEEQIEISKNKKYKFNLLVLNRNNNIVRPQNANSALERIVWHLLKVDDISTHSLRHTFGTRCIEAGISPVVVQKLMGHERIEITLNKYVDVLKKFQNDELKKLLKFYNKNKMFTTKDNDIDFDMF